MCAIHSGAHTLSLVDVHCIAAIFLAWMPVIQSGQGVVASAQPQAGHGISAVPLIMPLAVMLAPGEVSALPGPVEAAAGHIHLGAAAGEGGAQRPFRPPHGRAQGQPRGVWRLP